jgi:hypothetical protein
MPVGCVKNSANTPAAAIQHKNMNDLAMIDSQTDATYVRQTGAYSDVAYMTAF